MQRAPGELRSGGGAWPISGRIPTRDATRYESLTAERAVRVAVTGDSAPGARVRRRVLAILRKAFRVLGFKRRSIGRLGGGGAAISEVLAFFGHGGDHARAQRVRTEVVARPHAAGRRLYLGDRRRPCRKLSSVRWSFRVRVLF